MKKYETTTRGWVPGLVALRRTRTRACEAIVLPPGEP
jgi:hypothetical protein